jgi:hypothetical protein
MLRWLQQSGCESNKHTSYAAARTARNIEVLRLLQDSGCPCDQYACNAAVAASDLQQLQWLHELILVQLISMGKALPSNLAVSLMLLDIEYAIANVTKP